MSLDQDLLAQMLLQFLWPRWCSPPPSGSAQCPSVPSPHQFVHSQTLHPPGTSKFRLRPEALFSLARAHCIQKTSPSRPLCRIFLCDLIADWQLSFFSVFKIMPMTAFFACIFPCVLFSWQDLFVVIHARACS